MIAEDIPNETRRSELEKQATKCEKIVNNLIEKTKTPPPSKVREFIAKQAGRIGLVAALAGQGAYAAEDTVHKIDSAANITSPADKNTFSIINDVQDATAQKLNGKRVPTDRERQMNESINRDAQVKPTESLGTQFASGNTSSGFHVNPSETGFGASAYMQDGNYRLEASLMSAINGVSDTRAKASLAMLAEGAKLGTYIEVEAGSQLHRLALAESAVIGGTKVKLSLGFLSRVMEVGFGQYTQEIFKPEMSQRSA